MTLVEFGDEFRFGFVAEFLQSAGAAAFGTQLFPDKASILVNNPVVARLIQRVGTGQPVVLPYVAGDRDYWIVTAHSERELERTVAEAGRFLIPSYAEFTDDDRFPRLHRFDPSRNDLQRFGSTVYPVGHYRLQSLPVHRASILNRLDLWMNLTERRPIPVATHTPTYADISEAFREALVAANWSEAERRLQELRQLNLAPADNLAFLQVELLACQLLWTTIWDRADFSSLARLRMPRLVRAALLTAFHRSVLFPLEQQERLDESIAIFRGFRPRLGLLLTGRFGLTQDPVVRVFAYQAVLDGNRDALADLRHLAGSPETLQLFDALHKLLPMAERSLGAPVGLFQQVVQTLDLRDYDAAVRAAEQLPESDRRAQVLTEIAFLSRDAAIAERALLEFWSLPDSTQEEVRARDPRFRHTLDYLAELTGSLPRVVAGPPVSLLKPIDNWLEWFDAARDNPDNPEVANSLSRLAVVCDERFWTVVRIVELSGRLTEFAVDPVAMNRTYARKALNTILSTFVDEAFPREEPEYVELYEALYLCLLELRELNATTSMTLLRLAEAFLRRLPDRSKSVMQHFQEWFRGPVPALENCVLEAFDLLAEYGVPGASLVFWYREWIEYLLALPSPRERVSLEAWLAFGEWIQPGDDLLERLRQSLAGAEARDVENPVAALPAGYRIGIFSLRESSARRVRQALLARNPGLDVRICAETDLSGQAKSLAQSADLSVVVTTCLTHAMTYGIGPHLRNAPVYPQSSGSASILQAIEKQLTIAPLAIGSRIRN
jgi:hypothetical protein